MSTVTTRERVVLEGHTPRSRTTIHGVKAVLYGIPFLIAGLFVIALATGVVSSDESSWHAPRWVGTLAGLLFALAGSWVCVHGLLGLRRAALHRGRVELELEPWLADYPWDDAGRDADMPSILSHLLFPVVVTLFLAIVVGIMMSEAGSDSVVLWVAAGFLGLFWVGGCGALIHALSRRFKYGRGRLEFERFPFFLGEQLQGRFLAPKGIGRFRSLRFTVQCVEEAYETHGSGEDRRSVVVCYSPYQDERALEEEGEIVGPFDTPLSFPIPEDLPPTRLNDRPPTYWELVVEAATRGVNYRSVFLLPIYARPAR